MKRVKNRKKHFKINNPLGFSLFCAMIILILGLIVGTIIFFTSGAFNEMMTRCSHKLNEDPASAEKALPPEDETPEPVTETDSPEPTEEQQDPDATPGETPETGTPVPETPTPPPIQPETPRPTETTEPKQDTDDSLEGYTIGIDPTRDSGSKYKDETKYNLAFALKLKDYLESKGAKVVLTREDNKKEVGNSKRAKIIKNAKCDIAIRLMCNEVGSSTHGCYVQATKKNADFAKLLAETYSNGTGMKFQKDKKNGFEKLSSDTVSSNCGCPCARLIMGNWKNKSDRANLEDEAFQEKMMEAICEALLKQLRK